MNETTTPLDIEEAKRRARAELQGYRERKRLEREAKAKAEQTAEDEIAHAIEARRRNEANRAQIEAERQRIYAEREARIEAENKAERERAVAADPRLRIAETPARRAAKVLRKRLGDDFDAFVADLKLTDWRLFKIELARIPDDERCEALARQRAEFDARRLAEAATLPAPESEEERVILARYGFTA